MNRSKIIVLAMFAIMAAIFSLVSVYAYAFSGSGTITPSQPNTAASGTNGYYPNGMMGGNSGGMMNGNGMMGASSATPPSAQSSSASTNSLLPLVGLLALIGAVATGAGGTAYFLAGSKVRLTEKVAGKGVESHSVPNILAPQISVSKTLTNDERKVFDVLVSHDGKYLQKYIRAETGLSRLKTHRIVARLAERGIVTLEKTGNTNEVHISSWLQNSKSLEQSRSQSTNIEISA